MSFILHKPLFMMKMNPFNPKLKNQQIILEIKIEKIGKCFCNY